MRCNKTLRSPVKNSMKFTNRENEKVTLPDGRVIFLARSTAVVVCIICITDGVPHVLMVERGTAVDKSGKWCMPCGYLDWDETLYDAVIREPFEETGFDLTSIPEDSFIYRDKDMPHHIVSSPKENRQNVAHIFGVVFRGSLPKLDPSVAVSTKEVEQAEWVKLDTIPKQDEIENSPLNGMFAFEHDKRIHAFVELLRAKGVL